MAREEKPWGVTELLFHNGATQVNRVCVVAGGYSSRHCHANKANAFLVLRGRVFVSTYAIVGERLVPTGRATLVAGSAMVVQPTVVHRFYAAEPTEMIEAYYAPESGEVKLDDIIRFDLNGVAPRQTHDYDPHD